MKELTDRRKLTMKQTLFCHAYVNLRTIQDAVKEVYGEQKCKSTYFVIGNKILKKDHARKYLQQLIDNQHIEGQIERAQIIAQLKKIHYAPDSDNSTKFAALDRLMKFAGVSDEALTLGLTGTIRIVQD